MSLNLLDNTTNKGVQYNIATKQVDIEDTAYLSNYFILNDFKPVLTAGKNAIALNGSNLLKLGSEILVECTDSDGNALYIEMARNSTTPTGKAYKESTSYILSIHVYGNTKQGVGKLYLLGTTTKNQSVRWKADVTVDKTLKNTSKVRFYSKPTLSVRSILIPVIDSTIAVSLKSTLVLTGQFDGLCVTPSRDVEKSTVNRKNVDIDYRINNTDNSITRFTDPRYTFNSQIQNNKVYLWIEKIKKPFSNDEIPPSGSNYTSSLPVKKILNSKTLIVDDPYYYPDERKNNISTNIVDGTFTISYPYITYYTGSTIYQVTVIGGVGMVVRNSYADITYENIKTFSGVVARHKVYRKSLISPGEFDLIVDEPLFTNELLRNTITNNKFYEYIGRFYNQFHINRYWLTSSVSFSLQHTPDIMMDSVQIAPSASNYNTVDGFTYMIAKSDTSITGTITRDSAYLPYDSNEFLLSSGSKYDSNFIELKPDVQYILSTNAIMHKNVNETDAKITFYFTSSIPEATQENNFSSQFGIKLGELKFEDVGKTDKNFVQEEMFLFTPANNLYGTLVAVPYRCSAELYNVSLRNYGDDGVSPDMFTTRLPWGVRTAGETYEIKSELFDINSNLVYSNLRTIESFDPSGSSLIPYIPGGSLDPSTTTFISGSLQISMSLLVGDDAIITNDLYLGNPSIWSAAVNGDKKRFAGWIGDAGFQRFCITNVVDLYHDDGHIYLKTGSLNLLSLDFPAPIERKTLAAEWESTSGRKVYWINGSTKTVENG